VLTQLDYDPASKDVWKGLMMKQATKPDENGEIGWVFNNTKDSAHKVFKYLLLQVGLEDAATEARTRRDTLFS